MKTVAADVGVDYGKTVAPKDIEEMVDFMEQLYSIEVPDTGFLLADQNFVSPEKIFHLSQVDNITFHVGVQFFFYLFIKAVCCNCSVHTYRKIEL